jgi:hypothetical protein
MTHLGAPAERNVALTMDKEGNSLAMWAARVGNVRALRCVQ